MEVCQHPGTNSSGEPHWIVLTGDRFQDVAAAVVRARTALFPPSSTGPRRWGGRGGREAAGPEAATSGRSTAADLAGRDPIPGAAAGRPGPRASASSNGTLGRCSEHRPAGRRWAGPRAGPTGRRSCPRDIVASTARNARPWRSPDGRYSFAAPALNCRPTGPDRYDPTATRSRGVSSRPVGSPSGALASCSRGASSHTNGTADPGAPQPRANVRCSTWNTFRSSPTARSASIPQPVSSVLAGHRERQPGRPRR